MTEKNRFVIWSAIPWAIVAVLWVFSLFTSNINTIQLEHRGQWIRSVQEHLEFTSETRWTFQDQCNFAEINGLKMPAGRTTQRKLPIIPPESLTE
jgi:heme/copper-type cytochrome/quinol oxidase subunit 2